MMWSEGFCLEKQRHTGVKLPSWNSQVQPPKKLSLTYGALLLVGSSIPTQVTSSLLEGILSRQNCKRPLIPMLLIYLASSKTIFQWIMRIRKRDFKEKKKITAFGVEERFDILPPTSNFNLFSFVSRRYISALLCAFPKFLLRVSILFLLFCTRGQILLSY